MKKAGDDYYCIKYTFRGTNTIVVYVIAAAVIYFISYKIYKHRDLENAGSFIAIPKLKPVFRWGLGCLGGLILSTVTASLLLGLRISIGYGKLQDNYFQSSVINSSALWDLIET